MVDQMPVLGVEDEHLVRVVRLESIVLFGDRMDDVLDVRNGENGVTVLADQHRAIERGHGEILITEPLRQGVRTVIEKPVAPGEMVKNAVMAFGKTQNGVNAKGPRTDLRCHASERGRTGRG